MLPFMAQHYIALLTCSCSHGQERQGASMEMQRDMVLERIRQTTRMSNSLHATEREIRILNAPHQPRETNYAMFI